MSIEDVLGQIRVEPRSTPIIRALFSPPQLLPVCCLCGIIRDETDAIPGFGRWMTRESYRETHGVNPSDLPLTHTYCPECLVKVRIAVRQYFLELECHRNSVLSFPDIDLSPEAA